MRDGPTIIERAYELARSGTCAGLVEIERTLSRENYLNVMAHMSSPSLRRELGRLCRTALADSAAAQPESA
ncbi:hypothetical protein [Sphingomonas montanisoli]|uniref:Uncharacterized protein n=1 Tax=Sphingomonas montanisoli TaxID=2606412 RepID=A0A5D9CE88_9SPHN|nr:hypothetical protein [Sphingomonas montanisoli]TZG29300.1 hypothetical protein FYJ91_04000 [Sphingomonas montanisoli]